MLLAQINRDSQGMTEFPGGGMEAQHVTLCLTEAVTVAGELSGCGSLVLEHRLSGCGMLLRSMWDLPQSGIEPMSLALAG